MKLIKYAIIFLLLSSTPAFAVKNIYVNLGASGSSGMTSCDTWEATRACPDIPAMSFIDRGDTIYVGDGNYGSSVTLDKADDGTTRIFIKHATPSDHGVSTGWSDSYGDGHFQFYTLTVNTAYWTIDGSTGGGPGEWTTGFGCYFNTAAGTTVNYISVGLEGHHFTTRHCSFTQTGNVDVTDAVGTAFYFPGEAPMSGGGEGQNYRLLEYNYFDNLSGLPFFFRYGQYSIVQYNYVGHVCGAAIHNVDNHCEVVVEHGMNDFEFRYNYITEAPSSGAFVKNSRDGAVPNDVPSARIHIYGNVFRGAYGAGITVCNTSSPPAQCHDWRIFNNTIAYLSRPIKVTFETDGDLTGSLVLNNIIYGPNVFELYGLGMSGFRDYTYVSGAKGTVAFPTGAHGDDLGLVAATHDNGYGRQPAFADIITNTYTGGIDPFVNSIGNTPEDFKLARHITGALRDTAPLDAAGVDVCSIMGVTCDATETYDIDMLGMTRGSTDSIWDRGAFQGPADNCGTPSKVVFTSQPLSSVFSQSIGTVTAMIQDSTGNRCGQSTDNITLSKNGSATWGTLVSASNLTKAAVAGVATWTFPDLTVTTTSGSGSVNASVSGLTGATSTSITIASAIISIVQQSGQNGKCSTNGSGLGSTASVTVDATGANAIAGVLAYYTASGTPTVSDGGASYSYGTAYGTSSTISVLPFYKLGVSAGSLIITSSSTDYPAVCVMTLAGVKSASAYDQENGNYDAASTFLISTGSITPTEDDEIVISGFGGVSASNDTVNSGITPAAFTAFSDSLKFSNSIGYRFQPVGYPINATWMADGLFPLAGAIFSLKSDNPSCTPAKIFFGGDQPTSSILNGLIASVTVIVTDAGDNFCSDATNSITLSKNMSATWGTLTSDSSLTKSAVGGVATWTDLRITTTTGSGSLDAASSGLTGDTSTSITVSAPTSIGTRVPRMHGH